jgi:YggT family protein
MDTVGRPGVPHSPAVRHDPPVTVGPTLAAILSLYLFILLGRLVLDYVFIFARSWTPRGIALLLVEAIFSITDPPLKFLRRFIPPLRLGSINLDLSFLVLLFGIQILIRIVAPL